MISPRKKNRADADELSPPEEKELEDLRNRLRNILSGAYDQGVLEEVLRGG